MKKDELKTAIKAHLKAFFESEEFAGRFDAEQETVDAIVAGALQLADDLSEVADPIVDFMDSYGLFDEEG